MCWGSVLRRGRTCSLRFSPELRTRQSRDKLTHPFVMSKAIHTGSNQHGSLHISDDLLLCRGCGTQYQVTRNEGLNSCHICDDPRQYVPASGQSFTTLGELHASPKKHHLVFKQEENPKIWSITVEPNVGIGQRALFIQTPHGNVLWDLVCYLDDAAIEKINSLGGLSLIVISHPHFYTTWADWSRTFNDIPVYLASADQEWLSRPASSANLQLLSDQHTTLLPGITAIIAGGHFAGSMALHVDGSIIGVPSLFHADTIHTVVNAVTPDIDVKHSKALSSDHTDVNMVTGAGRGVTSYTFMWSIPNMIPLSPDQILGIWKALKGFPIEATYGFVTVKTQQQDRVSIPARILESAKICISAMGWKEHAIFDEIAE